MAVAILAHQEEVGVGPRGRALVNAQRATPRARAGQGFEQLTPVDALPEVVGQLLGFGMQEVQAISVDSFLVTPAA